MAAHLAHNQETRFESYGCNHCGVEKWLTHLAHNQEIVGSNPTHRNQGCAISNSPFLC